VILVRLARYLVVGPEAKLPRWHILAPTLIAALSTWLKVREFGTGS